MRLRNLDASFGGLLGLGKRCVVGYMSAVEGGLGVGNVGRQKQKVGGSSIVVRMLVDKGAV
jgi:hypothetical protein